MIPIIIPDTQNSLNVHWTGVESLFSKANKQDILKWVKRNELETLLGSEVNKQIKNLILATPSLLRQIANKVGGVLNTKDAQNFNLGFIKTKYNSFTGREEHLYRPSDLVENLGIKVCPYCNRTFIISTKRKNGEIKRTDQLDHFFPKSRYPYLALCFYNLIPSCSACNHIKKEQEIGLSPYEIERADDVITFEWKPKDSSFAYPKGNILITPTPNTKVNGQMQSNIDAFGLKDLYQNHDDVVKELLLKGEIYTKEYIDSLVESFPDLIENEEVATRLITCNYTSEEDLGKRPLAKLTRDIAREVKFIK
ncbi:HNH endonuclease [Marinifilum flexuosum]|uniref:HNH endonuclease n=1 Tax=Marinifilum flexuosum TaxID=1117708 RepID=A0A419WMX4_9BACT|nr:hypothetical protein [Marinifilum flexuosum]RKD96807.1 hypothetical protein BXY64_3754 [Marinifilum flexuosum]